MGNLGNWVLGEREKLDVALGSDPRRTDWHRCGKRLSSSLIPFDYAFIGIPFLLLYPAFRVARLPLRIDFVEITSSYWGGTACSATFVAIGLAIFGLPLRQTLMPFLARFRENKGRIVIALLLAAWLIYLFGFWLGAIVTVDALGVAELLERRKRILEDAIDIFVPALYLFLGLILVFSFNHALVGIRNPWTYDLFFQHLDWVLFHVNVTDIAHWSLSHLPIWFFKLLEFTYYSLYGRLMAVLIFAALLRNQQFALKYVRTLLICYAIALVVYSVLPAKGPYSICPIHLSSYPRSLLTFWTQEALVMRTRMLWAHNITSAVIAVNPEDYYISLPSLHVALPIIAIWFVRPWKRIALLMLGIYVLLLLPSVLLLEWHYLVDFFAGFATAFLAIWLAEKISCAGIKDELLHSAPVPVPAAH